MWLLLMVIGALLEVVGDVFFKKWGQHSRTWLACVGLVAYGTGSVAWMYALRNRDLGRSVAVFMIINALLAVVLGIALFDEKLTTAHRIGILCALLGLYLLES